jgi:hypothetical protein
VAKRDEGAHVDAQCGCGAQLWRRRSGEWTLQNRIIKLTPGGLVAKCPQCREDVPIPWLRIVPTEAPPSSRRRLVIKPST